MNPSQTKPETFTMIVEDLYAGTLDTVAWNRAIMGIVDMVRASGAALLVFDPSNGAVLHGENYRLDSSVLSDYQQYWVHEDIRLRNGLNIPVGCPVTELTLAIPAWRRTRILNEFLLPSDVPHFMPAWLHKSETKAATFSLQGTRTRGPFDSRDIENFRRILPHLSRTLEIRDRLERAQINSATVPAALEAVGFGVIILNSNGKLLESNRLAQVTLGSSGQGVRQRSDGTLWLREPAGAQLSRWVSTGLPPPQSSDGLLHVPRENGTPLSILVTPLAGQRGTSWVSPDPRWLLLIFDPDMRASADVRLIAKDLRISAREAEISALLLAGETLQAIARRFRVSRHTVRAQLKSIYKKTGIGSQSELVRRVAFGPALHTKVPSINVKE